MLPGINVLLLDLAWWIGRKVDSEGRSGIPPGSAFSLPRGGEAIRC